MHVIYYCVDQKIPPVLSKTMQEINIYIYIINGHVCVAFAEILLNVALNTIILTQTLCDKVNLWLAACRRVFPETDRHDIIYMKWNNNFSHRLTWSHNAWFRIIMFNATFSNTSVISWWSVLLVEETGRPGGNHQPVASHWQTVSHNVVSSTLRHQQDSNSQH